MHSIHPVLKYDDAHAAIDFLERAFGFERLLVQALSAGGDGTGIEPGLADTIVQQAANASQQQEAMGLTPVLLVPGPLRTLLSRFLRRALPQLKVLSHSEIPESKTIRVTSLVGA